MLCELNAYTHSLPLTWAILTVLALAFLLVASGVLFRLYYIAPSYETWVTKTNPRYPPPKMVRQEILFMLKGLAAATFCPAASLWMLERGMGYGYCGNPFGWKRLAVEFAGIWVGVDLYEMMYHRFGHKTKKGWEVHRQHHVFFNPTPFAVIADEYLDQFIRALPLLLLPSLFRINIDLLFFTFSTFFYLYGLVLHLGHEVLFDSHSKVVNTGYHHYLHHAVSTYGGRTWHTGFFLQAWDRMLGSIYTGDCLCAGCSVKRGERTREEFAKVEKPSYTELLDIAFWVEGVREVWAGKKGEVGVKGE